MFKKRFEVQVARSVALLSLLLITVTVGGAIWVGGNDALQRIGEDSASLATDMASALDTTMFDRYREIQTVANIGPFHDIGTLDAADIRSGLNKLQASLPAYTWVGFARPDGVVLAATNGLLEGVSVAGRPWFAKGLKRPSVSDVHDAVLLAKALAVAPRAEPFRLVDVSVPVFDRAHTLIGVLGAHLSWTWADDIKQRLIGRLGDAAGTTDLWILSGEGKLLLGPVFGSIPFGVADLAMMQRMKHGFFEDRSGAAPVLTGFAATAGYRDYPGLGWIVVTRRKSDIAYASVYHSARIVLVLSVIMAGVGIILAWLLARRIAEPLRRLTTAVGQIGRDPETTTLPWLDSSQEFVELSSSLRSLLRRLGIAEQGLSDKAVLEHDISRDLQLKIAMLKTQADQDPMTGLLNRRAFSSIAEDAILSYQRHNQSMAILMLDIDFFKKVNDTHGHLAGDMVICRIADVLKSVLRPTDRVARFGGEEFIILLRDISIVDAVTLAERIRASVEALDVGDTQSSFSVTISVGATIALAGDRDIETLIERADTALYMAKTSGRNIVKFRTLN